MKGLFAVLTGIIVASCSPTTQPSSTSNTRYEEDLSDYRPSVPEIIEETGTTQSTEGSTDVTYIEPTEHLRTEIDSVLRIKAARSAEIGYLSGFTIQVYTGRSREAANRSKNIVYEILLDEEAKVSYDQPMFRVKVGQYYTRLEAEKNLNLLRKRFPQALVLPERIALEE